ncbi:MAG: diphthamide biosynthesis enzyme Dph2 [Thermoplasmatales archaeon]|jgi:2-(3-amino-3-carboxypropyl)histidine synthase|nr:diphthamide biosynthesis enzyme Dph2 [Thermoplasmatales archaeon]
MFDLRLDEAADWIRAGGYACVALQLPEGLKSKSIGISRYLSERTGASFFFAGDPCYGACDIFDYKGKADALVHFGHSPIPSQGDDPDVMYVEAFYGGDIGPFISAIADDLPGKIGLMATVQYVPALERAREVLEAAGKKVMISPGDGRISYPGQALGCNSSAMPEGADHILFIGEGDFHPLAAALGTDAAVTVLNPITGEHRSIAELKERMLRRRFAVIESARSAERFLVVVCSKKGQDRTALADSVVKKVRSVGKEAYKVRLTEVGPDALSVYADADAYIMTACPRIALDDSVRYKKPMLTPPEAEISLGLRDWEDYIIDEIRSPRQD